MVPEPGNPHGLAQLHPNDSELKSLQVLLTASIVIWPGTGSFSPTSVRLCNPGGDILKFDVKGADTNKDINLFLC